MHFGILGPAWLRSLGVNKAIMKRVISLLALVAGQIAAVLLFARLAGATTGSLGGSEIAFIAFPVYGIPAVAAFVGHMCLTVCSSPRLKSVGIRLLAAGFITFFGSGFAVGTLQRTDIWLTNRYIARMQTLLAAEPRFQKVQMLGYSCDYILFPYIPVHGDVSTEQDRQDLDRLLKSSSPLCTCPRPSFRLAALDRH